MGIIEDSVYKCFFLFIECVVPVKSSNKEQQWKQLMLLLLEI